MKLNKTLILALIAAAFVSQVEARTEHAPQKVEQAVDQQGNRIEGKLNVKDKNEWHLFKKHSAARELGGEHRPKYEYTDNTHTALRVNENNGSYTIYVKVRELTPEEQELIMMEDVLQD